MNSKPDIYLKLLITCWFRPKSSRKFGKFIQPDQADLNYSDKDSATMEEWFLHSVAIYYSETFD